MMEEAATAEGTDAPDAGAQTLARVRPPGRMLISDVRIRVSAAANTKQLEKRFNYLWQSAHSILPTNALLAHQMISSMMEMARTNRVELPAAVLDFICECCGALIVPSLSANVRVQSQTHKSRANRKLTRERRKLAAQTGIPGVPQLLLNVLRVSCRRCNHVNIRAGASEIIKPKSKKRQLETPAAEVEPEVKRTRTTEPTPASESNSVPETKLLPQEQPRSMFAPPPSPPRKLLDGPKKKKKKKAPDAAVTAVKSNLSSFLQSLRPGTSK
ncbi:Rnase p, rpr2/rpp21 subunit [Globisporangium polare]